MGWGGRRKRGAGKLLKTGSYGEPSIYEHRPDFFTLHAASYLSPTAGQVVATARTRESALRLFDEMLADGLLAWPHGRVDGGRE